MYIKLLLVLTLFLVGGIMNIQSQSQEKLEKATFAGGCFWCMEAPFEKLNGVIDVISGYTGGTATNPTYKTYADQGHIEAVQITYDPNTITYKELLEVFWRQIDPTDPDGQFVDRGKQYRSAIFYHNQEQKNLAEQSKQELQASGRFKKPIVTEILPASPFYKAEDYHQDFYKNHSWKYTFYRFNSGRDQFLNKIWNTEPRHNPHSESSSKYHKPSDAELRKRLTPIQYHVTQENGTEPAYKNEYWNNKKPGIYVDIVSGEPLFSSTDKYDSKTGWPSFTKPLEPENIIEKEDQGWFTTRTEVRSKLSDSHLGHVFKDGPPPTGLRYCMNSAALRFIPVAELDKEGYKQYKKLF